MGIFKIEAENLGWINGAKDDPNDLCLHGHAVFLYSEPITGQCCYFRMSKWNRLDSETRKQLYCLDTRGWNRREGIQKRIPRRGIPVCG